jgi:transcription factor IIIB subunit 2
MLCQNCGSKEIMYQSEISSSICLECVRVLENIDEIINENPYSENLKIGNNYNLLISNHLLNSDLKIKKIFQKLISSLNLPEYFLENAIKYYKCASNKNFAKGRSQILICSIILYTLCRINKTQHLLIDFSNVSKINIYKLGNHYLQFIKLFNINIDLIDPSLFLKRFINKLNLDLKSQKNVYDISLKIIQCMKKDWLIEGRNPLGICGASIYLSLSINNFKSDINFISKIVNIRKETIKKRINEFLNSRFSKFRKDEFLNLNLNLFNDIYPPSFIKNRFLDEKNEKNNKDNLLLEKKINSEISSDNDNITLTKSESCKNLVNNDNLFLDAQLFLGKKHNENNIELKDNNYKDLYNEENLSELSESEDSKFIIKNDEEYKIKKAIWEEKNKEWINEQKEKKLIRKKLEKMNKDKINRNLNVNYKNPKEAILHNEKFLKMRIKNKVSFMEEILHNDIFLTNENKKLDNK